MGWGKCSNNYTQEIIPNEGEMMFLAIVLLMINNCMVFELQGKYICSQSESALTTEWGHRPALLDFSNKPVKFIRGQVLALSKMPVEGALVEVVHLDETSSPIEADGPVTRFRQAVCVTNKYGGFSFDLSPGRYQLIVSKLGWNSTSALIFVNTRNGKKRDLLIPLRIGD
jgi:hypothetical protein